MKLIYSLFLTLILAVGCATVELADGTKLSAFGQSEASFCKARGEGVFTLPEGGEETEQTEGDCIHVKGGPVSAGMTDLFRDLVKLPGAVIRGIAAPLP